MCKLKNLHPLMGLFQSCFFWYDIDTVKDREFTKRTP